MEMDSVEANTPLMGGKGIYGSLEGTRTVQRYDDEPEIWECVPDCPLRMLNEQSGNLSKSGGRPFMDSVDGTRPLGKSGIYGKGPIPLHRHRFGDKGGAARFFYCPKPSAKERALGLDVLGLEHNPHVTVKPIRLMRYLIRLITPFGGVVADPFLGAGTTAIAAEMEGFRWVGCDNNKDYCDIARARIEAARKQARAEP